MKSRNKTQLVGYLGNDPEIFTFPSGTMKAYLRLSTSSKTRQIDLFGQPVYRTTWHDVVIWGKERVEKIIHQYIKGSHVMVEGQIFYRSYTDKAGVKHNPAVIRAYSTLNLDR